MQLIHILAIEPVFFLSAVEPITDASTVGLVSMPSIQP